MRAGCSDRPRNRVRSKQNRAVKVGLGGSRLHCWRRWRYWCLLGVIGIWSAVLVAGPAIAQSAAASPTTPPPAVETSTAAPWLFSSLGGMPWNSTTADRPQTEWIEFDGIPVFQIAAPSRDLARRASVIDQQLTLAGDRYLRDPQGKLDVVIEAAAPAPNVGANGTTPATAPQPNAQPTAKAVAPRILVNGRYVMTVTTLDAGTQLTEPSTYAVTVKSEIMQAFQRAREDRTPTAVVQQVRSVLALWLVALGGHLILGWMQQRLQHWEANDKGNNSNGVELEGLALTSWLQQRYRDYWRSIAHLLMQIAQPGLWVVASLWALGTFPASRWIQVKISSTLEAYLRLGIAALMTYVAILLSYIAIDRATAILTAGTQMAPRVSPRLQQRVLTLSSILKSCLTVLLTILGVIVGLASIGVDVGPLVAGAGLVGVALSLASQNLIKDAINGFLILAEDQFSVGDAIAVGNLTGHVESLTLRATKLRDAEQRLIVIPNSEIRTVANLSNHYSQADLKIPIAYGADLERALELLAELASLFAADPDWQAVLLDRPQVLGIDEFAAHGTIVRIWIRTAPLEQWSVAREFRRRVAVAFAAQSIELAGQSEATTNPSPLDRPDRPSKEEDTESPWRNLNREDLKPSPDNSPSASALAVNQSSQTSQTSQSIDFPPSDLKGV
ncbi:MAG: mechanosensitive ion channel family protein [Oscillatoriales cyanobacterium]|nr:MAG: mechanosensitive ion channel family protein [Oscillatoriales cyanobacterium]